MISQLEVITDLFKKCRKEELKIFRSYLKAFDPGTGKFRSKSYILFELINKNKFQTEEEFCKKIYGKIDKNSLQAFNRLLNRFKSKLYECLTLDINVYRQDSFADVTQYKIELRKLAIYFTALRGRLINQEFVRLMERAIYIAKKHEFYYEIISLLNAKTEILGFVSTYDKLKNIENEIQYYEKVQDAFRGASLWHQKLVLATRAKARGYDEIDDFKTAIKQISEDCKKYKSANIEYFLLLIKMEFAHKNFNYELAEEISFQQLKLYNSSPAVYLKARVASAFLNLGNNQLYLYKFKEAIKSVQSSYPIYNIYKLNLFIAMEIEVYIHYYSGNLSKAEEILKLIMHEGKNFSTPFQISKRNFLLTNILFLKNQHKQTHLLLQDTKEIDRDKEGWNLGIRILSIINQLEVEKLDIVDLNIESMRKHIDRTLKMKVVRKRDVVILRLLAKLSRQGFNFKEVWKKNLKYFELLASDDPDYRWEMKSPEMIVFHKWFEAKAKGKEYDYVLKGPESLKLLTGR